MSFSPILMSAKYDNIEYWLHHQLSPHAHIYVKAVSIRGQHLKSGRSMQG